MHRRIRQENPEVALVWRHAFGNGGAFHFRQQHDGPLAAGQKSSCFSIDLAKSRRGFQIPHHQGKGFLNAPFALAKPFDCGRVCCICGKMKSAESLDGDYLAQSKALRRRFGRDRQPRSHGPGSPRTRAEGRISSRHSAARGNGGIADLHIPRGIARTSGSPTSRCAAGRRGRPARS